MRKALSATLAATVLLVGACACVAQSGPRPLVVVSFAGYDRLVADIGAIGQWSGDAGLGQRVQLVLLTVPQSDPAKGPLTLDTKRPWGAALWAASQRPFPTCFCPLPTSSRWWSWSRGNCAAPSTSITASIKFPWTETTSTPSRSRIGGSSPIRHRNWKTLPPIRKLCSATFPADMIWRSARSSASFPRSTAGNCPVGCARMKSTTSCWAGTSTPRQKPAISISNSRAERHEACRTSRGSQTRQEPLCRTGNARRRRRRNYSRLAWRRASHPSQRPPGGPARLGPCAIAISGPQRNGVSTGVMVAGCRDPRPAESGGAEENRRWAGDPTRRRGRHPLGRCNAGRCRRPGGRLAAGGRCDTGKRPARQDDCDGAQTYHGVACTRFPWQRPTGAGAVGRQQVGCRRGNCGRQGIDRRGPRRRRDAQERHRPLEKHGRQNVPPLEITVAVAPVARLFAKVAEDPCLKADAAMLADLFKTTRARAASRSLPGASHGEFICGSRSTKRCSRCFARGAGRSAHIAGLIASLPKADVDKEIL